MVQPLLPHDRHYRARRHNDEGEQSYPEDKRFRHHKLKSPSANFPFCVQDLKYRCVQQCVAQVPACLPQILRNGVRRYMQPGRAWQAKAENKHGPDHGPDHRGDYQGHRAQIHYQRVGNRPHPKQVRVPLPEQVEEGQGQGGQGAGEERA